MFSYIDSHAHILWHTDDGPDTKEKAVKMLRMAARNGTKHIIATQHYKSLLSDAPSRDTLVSRVAALNQVAAKENLSIHVYSGNEVYADADSLDALLNGSALTLAESQYVLVELSSLLSTQVVLQIVLQMRQNGFIPVLAHVERSFRCKNRLAFSRMLVENGALLQVDAHSLFYRFGLRTALFVRKLLRNHLVFVVASDCHNLTTRAPLSPIIAARLRRICGKAYAQRLLWDNPMRFLSAYHE